MAGNGVKPFEEWIRKFKNVINVRTKFYSLFLIERVLEAIAGCLGNQ